MALQPEKPEPGGPDDPTVETVRADMGEVRRQFWIAAALHHLGHDAALPDAEDVLQEFISQNIPAACRNYVPGKGSFQSYLWDSFKYYCWRYGKRERGRRLGHVPVETVYEDGTVEIRIADERALTPLELAEIREQRQILANALAELTDLQRRSWMAVEVDGLTYAAAASQIRVPEATLTVELYRARQRIHELIHHYPRTFLSVGEIRDWAGLCRGLHQDGENATRTVGKRVWDLGTDTLHAIAETSSPELSAQAQAQLIRELNDVLGRQDFYSSKHVSQISKGKFATEIRSLLRRKGGPLTARRLNKLLFRNHYDRFFLGES